MLQAIGNTPLIEIKSLSELTGCKIYGKAEFLNPGGSIKDRAALWMVEEAEKNGQLTEGGTIFEGMYLFIFIFICVLLNKQKIS